MLDNNTKTELVTGTSDFIGTRCVLGYQPFSTSKIIFGHCIHNQIRFRLFSKNRIEGVNEELD
jgi:hypothetical protein